MTADPRAALATLMSAFERHLEASASKRERTTPPSSRHTRTSLTPSRPMTKRFLPPTARMTPLEIYDDSEDEEIDDHSDEDGDGGLYSGLDDSDYDEDDEDASAR